MKSLWVSALCFMMALPAMAMDTAAEKRTHIYLGMDVVSPDLDVLFVVDSSGSMNPYQHILSQSSKDLQTLLIQNRRDYHLGVISMDVENGPYSNSPAPGSLLGNPKVITLGNKGSLETNIRIGTEGSFFETPFDSISLALSPAMLAKENAGFIRPDARLAIVLLTDAEDQSQVMQHQLLTQLDTLKGGLENIKMLSWIIPSSNTDNSCVRDGDQGTTPLKIEEITRYLKGSIYNLCKMDQNSLAQFHQELASFGVHLEPSMLEIKLKEKPAVETIVVQYGGQIVEMNKTTGWDYDAAKNAVVISKKVVWTQQPAGTELHVSYYPKK